jgi:hypothetical protein
VLLVEPEGQAAPIDQRPVVFRPVRHSVAVFRLRRPAPLSSFVLAAMFLPLTRQQFATSRKMTLYCANASHNRPSMQRPDAPVAFGPAFLGVPDPMENWQHYRVSIQHLPPETAGQHARLSAHARFIARCRDSCQHGGATVA